MKRKIIAGLAALLTALAFAGCGEVEDAPQDVKDSSQAETSSVTDGTESVSDDGSRLADTPPADDSSMVELRIMTYSGEQVPQALKDVIMRTLAGAAGEYGEFERVFDPDILIEARIRTALTDPDQIAEVRSQFDGDARRQTTRQNYDMLHSDLAGVSFGSDFSAIKLQSLTGDIDSSVLFSINFDVPTDKGEMTFMGNAYHIDGKWGAVFERGEHMTEDEINEKLKEQQK